MSATLAPEPTPALLQTRCTAPKRSSVVWARAWTLWSEATSVTTPTAPSSCAAASSAAGSMSAMTTLAPSARSRRAMPLPIPEAPPVTTAVLPARSLIPLIAALRRSHRA